jgi:hypothetical protein
MRLSFTVDDQKKVTPSTDKDKRIWQSLRNKSRPGTRLIFEIFADRSSAQHRFIWAIYAYAIFACEAIAGKYQKPEDLHAALKWQFCMMRPEYFVEIPVWIDGQKATAKVPFSESPKNGIDSQGMNEYTAYALDEIAHTIGISVMQLQSESKKHAEGIDE